MTSDERTLISNLFERLKQASSQQKDAGADEYIRTKVSEQPSAPYILVQSTLVMQQALTAAQGRIAHSRSNCRDNSAKSGVWRKLPFRGRQSLWGRSAASHFPPAADAPATPNPACFSTQLCSTTYSTISRSWRRVLQSALSTAAGVAGGALLFQGIQNMLGHNPGPFAGLAGPTGEVVPSQPVENTDVNVFDSNDPSSATEQSTAADDMASDQDATADDGSMSDSTSDDSFAPDDGGDFQGGGDDSYV